MFARMALFAIFSLAAASAHAGAITSDYTDIDPAKTCKVLGQAKDGEGDWVDYDCAGYGEYRVRLQYADARESLSYGYRGPKDFWESFQGFNNTGPKIEWRLEDGAPFATIHRWFVTVSGEDAVTEQILVVSKVGQKGGQGSCVVGAVRATGNAKANEQARDLADQKARAFTCGQAPTLIGDVPDLSRHELDP